MNYKICIRFVAFIKIQNMFMDIYILMPVQYKC